MFSVYANDNIRKIVRKKHLKIKRCTTFYSEKDLVCENHIIICKSQWIYDKMSIYIRKISFDIFFRNCVKYSVVIIRFTLSMKFAMKRK